MTEVQITPTQLAKGVDVVTQPSEWAVAGIPGETPKEARSAGKAAENLFRTDVKLAERRGVVLPTLGPEHQTGVLVKIAEADEALRIRQEEKPNVDFWRNDLAALGENSDLLSLVDGGVQLTNEQRAELISRRDAAGLTDEQLADLLDKRVSVEKWDAEEPVVLAPKAAEQDARLATAQEKILQNEIL